MNTKSNNGWLLLFLLVTHVLMAQKGGGFEASYLTVNTANELRALPVIDTVPNKVGLEKRVMMNKNIYTRKAFGTNNYIDNGDFSNSLTSWTAVDMTSSLGGSLASVVTLSGKNWLKLNCSDTSTTPSSRGYMVQTVNIPPALRYAVLEFSYDSFDFLQGVSLNNEQVFSYNVDIPQSRPERIYQYIRPNGSSTITVKLFRCPYGQERTGKNVYFSNVQLAPAEYVNRDVSYNVPTVGLNVQLARWLTDWDQDEHYQYLKKVKGDITPFIRVWLSSELFATYTNKSSPTKRSIGSGNLSSSYDTLTKAKIPSGFSADIAKVDWFFKTCDELGIKLHVVLGAGFGTGDPDKDLSKIGTYEFLDTDTDFQTGLTNYFVSIVNRYKSYKNIVGYEFINEGYYTWRTLYAGYSASADYARVRPGSYGGYRAWERATYAAVKEADPTRPVILDLALESSNSQYLADVDGVCDWYCPSIYLGKISLNVANVGSNTFYPTKNYPYVLGNVKNGYKLIPYASAGTLPTGLTAGNTYYVVNITSSSFQVSTTLGGSPQTISGGSGNFYFYSPDGSLLDVESAVLDRLADCNKFVYFSEFGAPIMENKLLYRDSTYNAAYITAMLQRLGQYKVPAFIAFDEHNLFFDSQYVNKKPANRLMSGSSVIEVPKAEVNQSGNNQVFVGANAGTLRISRTIGFNTSGTTVLGAVSFGVTDKSSKFYEKEFVRIAGYSDANAYDSTLYNAPGSLYVEGQNGTSSLVWKQLFRFSGSLNLNQSLVDFQILNPTYNANRLMIGNIKIWQNTAGKLVLYPSGNPANDAAGREILSNASDGSFTHPRIIGTSNNATPLSVARTGTGSNDNQFDFAVTSGYGGAAGALNILSINAASDIAFRGKTSGNVQWKMVGATGDFEMALGGKIKIATGTNASVGTATLASGTVTVNTSAVTASSQIIITVQETGQYNGRVRVSARTAGTSFTISSSDNTDTAQVSWIILN